ncbi:DUF298-domain-containing protein [Xylariaceae sp. FL1651]|nr:DUF298-domain-containing protein [Xylariaceae sp. FL1651]
MPPQTSAQKAAIASFVAITGATERTASKYLKSASYKLNEAVDAYFQASGSSSSAQGPSKDAQLNKYFDSLRNEQEDAKDTLGADSAMSYLQSVGVGLEDASLFIAVELLQAPNIGEIPRAGFVNGWKEAGIEGKTEPQAAHLRYLAGLMTKDRDLFRKVYRYAFVAGKEGDQRALSLEMALLYWDTLFKKPGQSWVGSSTKIDWLNEWTTFLQENWKRSVNRDMWNQTLEFAFKSIEDESLNFWNEDGAWPGVIDEFVAWYRRKSEMEVDA